MDKGIIVLSYCAPVLLRDRFRWSTETFFYNISINISPRNSAGAKC